MDATAAATARGRHGEEKNTAQDGGGADAGKKVPFAGLFRHADGADVLLMLVGTAAALANGMAQPLMTVIFGQVINAFGGATTDDVLSRVNKVRPETAVYQMCLLQLVTPCLY
jgi:ATP-binding cassette subfamily B (MDR/TAP) protein 1